MAFVSDPMDRPPEPRLWTAEEYLRAAEAGLFAPDERLELLNGEIVLMSPTGLRHAACVTKITRWLSGELPKGQDFVIQSTTRMGLRNVPEPDIAVLKASVDDLAGEVQGTDLELVIEVSETTLTTDRGRKARIYADAGVPEYWIVNLNARAIEVHREPTDDGYRLIRRYGDHERVQPLFLAKEVEVSDLLPRRA